MIADTSGALVDALYTGNAMGATKAEHLTDINGFYGDGRLIAYMRAM